MPGEAEISFEEAIGGSTAITPAAASSPISPSKGEISFAEAAGPVAPSGPSFREKLSQGVDIFKQNQEVKKLMDQRGEQTRRALFTDIFGEVEETPGEGFAARTGKAALRGLRAVVTSPTKAAVGGAKAIVSGAVSMGEQFSAGIQGLGRLGGEALIRETVGRIPAGATTAPFLRETRRAAETQPLDAAVEQIETSMEETAAMREAASQIAKINLAPETEQDKAMEGLLMVIPEGITAAGDTVYEKTGSALAGAGTQGLLTLLTFKPQLAGKVVESSIKSVKSKELFNTTFDALAISEPEAAKAVVDHIATTDPKTASRLKVRLKTPEERAAYAERVGKKVVENEVKAVGKELTPEEVGVGLSETAAETPKVEAKPQVKAAAITAYRGVQKGREALSADGTLGDTLHFSSSEQRAKQFARGGKISAVQLEFDNPLQAKNWGEVVTKLGIEVDFAKMKASDVTKAVAAEARKAGYDGIIYDTAKGTEYVVLDPKAHASKIKELSDTKRDIVEEPTADLPPPPEQIFIAGATLDAIPGGQFIKGKLTSWWDELIHAINPEALGPKAKQAAAVLGEKIAQTMNRDSANIGLSAKRLEFWQKVPQAEISDFMKRFEQGKAQKTPELQTADKYIRERMKEMYEQDQRNGIKYDPVDNYLYHIFDEGDKLAKHFEAKYGAKWGDPKFTKDRAFDLYEEAVAAGYRPKFTNPEDIVLARQQASDVAQMRVELLKDLTSYGLAHEVTKANPGPPKGGQYNYRRSPTGQGYWVEASADAVLHNAFDTKSLWSMPGIRGDLFKGAMFLKNHTVPAVLSLSLFHPLHLLLGMDSAAAMTRLTKEMVVSGMNPVKWFGKWLEQMTLGSKGIPLWGIVDNPRVGYRLLQAVEGKIDPKKLTAADLTALRYMNEGGFAPVQPIHLRANAMENFRKSVREVAAEVNGKGGLGRAAKPALKAGFHAPFAIIDAMQYPMFRLWIPALKIASYLKDVQTALKLDPTLAQDKARRVLAFRKLSKSVDNRYGEMNYNTLFWNRMIKDTAVANMLSLGWNLGFLREYGGGAIDVVRSTRSGKLVEKVKAGELDRPLFVMFYTTQTMLYSGLLTWALTGKPPTEFMDYLYPKSGDKDSQGRDVRLSTPFYPREFAAIAKHVEHSGLAPGLWHTISNKSSGVIGLVNQWATGVDWRGHEIRDPNAHWAQQMRDTLAVTLADLEPISVGQLRGSERTTKDVVTSITGFGPAPKYVTQSDTEASISQLYQKYYAPKQTPYEKALISKDRSKLAKLYDQGKVDEYGDLLDEMAEKYSLTAEEQGRLARNIMRRGVDYNPFLTMFERLTWQQQKRLLDKMSPDERDIYLPRSNRQHLRYTYEEPSK